MKEKVYQMIAQQEEGYVKAYGYAEAKEKILSHLTACYGLDYDLLHIIDVTDHVSIAEYDKNKLI
jgi:hypothetical protein